MKLEKILREMQDSYERLGNSREKAIPQIRKEVEELVKKSHGWTDFKKNLDKFCEEE